MQPQKTSEAIFLLQRLDRNGFQEQFVKFVRLQGLVAVDECNDDDGVFEALLGEEFVDFCLEVVNDAIVFMPLVVLAEKLKVVEAKNRSQVNKKLNFVVNELTPR